MGIYNSSFIREELIYEGKYHIHFESIMGKDIIYQRQKQKARLKGDCFNKPNIYGKG